MHLPNLLPAVIDLVVRAGEMIVSESFRPDGPRGSGDKAAIDLEVERLLREGLLQLLPCDFVGEETGLDLRGASSCWVVDPNDGTADFLLEKMGSAISVGLLQEGKPVLGVVYAPLTPRGADCLAWQQGRGELRRNGIAITRQLATISLSGSVVFVSAAAKRHLELNDELCAPARCEPMPSIAYRLARVAAGDGVAAISLYPVSPHDVVAGHALLRAVGGELFDHTGAPITYDSDVRFARPVSGCFGGAAGACQLLIQREWQRLVPNYRNFNGVAPS